MLQNRNHWLVVSNSCVSSEADSWFSWEGDANSQSECPNLFFAENCLKMKKLDPRKAGPWHPPPFGSADAIPANNNLGVLQWQIQFPKIWIQLKKLVSWASDNILGFFFSNSFSFEFYCRLAIHRASFMNQLINRSTNQYINQHLDKCVIV